MSEERADVTITTHARAISLAVTCTLGGQASQDESCDAVLSDNGRVLAHYRPRSFQPLESWQQTVMFPNHVLVTDTRWNYALDPAAKHPVKTTPRTGPHWR